MDDALDLNPLTILTPRKQIGHRRLPSVQGKVRVSDDLHTPVDDYWCIVSSSADSGDFNQCPRLHRKNRTGGKSYEYAARGVMDKHRRMSRIDVGIVIS